MSKLMLDFDDLMRRATHAHRKPAGKLPGRILRRTVRKHRLYKFFRWLERSAQHGDATSS